MRQPLEKASAVLPVTSNVIDSRKYLRPLDPVCARAYKRPMMYAQAIIIRITSPAL
jgi:hypothetical protein